MNKKISIQKIDKTSLHGRNIFEKIKNLLVLNPIKRIFLVYIFLILVSTILFSTPITWKSGFSGLTFIKAMFFSCSAITDTGLTSTSSVFVTFNGFGEFILWFLVIFGGLGFMAIKVMIFFIIRKKLSIGDIDFIAEEKGLNKNGGSVKLIAISIFILLGINFLFGIALALHFHFDSYVMEYLKGPSMTSGQELHNNFWYALWVGIFSSTSAINNAGLDVFGNYSLEPFYRDYFLIICFIILIFIGGIGFPVYLDLYEKYHARKRGEIHIFSLFTKVTTSFYLGLLVFSLAAIFIIEVTAPNNYTFTVDSDWMNNPAFRGGDIPNQGVQVRDIFHDPNFSTTDKFFFVFFSLISARNAGFQNISPQRFMPGTKIILALNMWIGASPCSTGGGIRLTTFAIMLLTISSYWRQSSKITIYQRTISNSSVIKSIAVTSLSLVLILFVSLFLTSDITAVETQRQTTVPNGYHYTFLDSFFEACSAFGTTGLSSGLSSEDGLSVFSRIGLIFLMFIGQLTISGTILVGRKSLKPTSQYSFAEERLMIG